MTDISVNTCDSCPFCCKWFTANVQAVAVFRAALAAPGPGLDASSFRAVAGVLEAAGDWQQAVSIFEVMGARVCASSIVKTVVANLLQCTLEAGGIPLGHMCLPAL
jgi:hypothetical protein